VTTAPGHHAEPATGTRHGVIEAPRPAAEKT
jgi:hypothetical protein